MAEDRFSRFKNLERGRRDEPQAQPATTSGRFSALEQTRQAAEPHPASPVVTVERFSAAPGSQPAAPIRTLEDAQRAAQGASGLELAVSQPGDQPFIRCCHCQHDNHSLAVACTGCGANLNTPNQAAFNERLWRQHQAALAAPEPEPPAPATPVAPAPVSPSHLGKQSGLDPAQQRAVGEAIARDVARQAAGRLGGIGLGLGVGGWSLSRWVLTELSPRRRALVLGLAVGLPTLLMLLPGTRVVGTLLFLGAGALLLRAWFVR